MSFNYLSWDGETSLKYHLRQWETPKESTLVFADFVRPLLQDGISVVDLGCGAGAATAFLARHFRNIKWTGIDSNEVLISEANSRARALGIENLSYDKGDFVQCALSPSFDGAISLQTLSWLPDFDEALSNILRTLNPRWFAFSSLFYEGDISAITKVYLHNTLEIVHYNTYSLPAVSRLAKDLGFSLAVYAPFEIPVSLPKPTDKDKMGTYTLDISEDNQDSLHRIQISGPVLMSWYNVLLTKDH